MANELAFSGLVSPRLSPGFSEFIIENWSVRDGLPRSGVTAIAQTPDGFLWLGLKRGMARFDGFQFKHFSPSIHPGLVTRPINTLFVDRSGKLWIGSEGDGGSVMENSQFRKLNGLDPTEGDDIRQFAQDSDGVVWRASLRGIHFYDKEVAHPVAEGELAGATSYRVVWDSYLERMLACYWETAGAWRNGTFERLRETDSDRVISSNNFFTRRNGGVWVLSSDPSNYGALHRSLPNGTLTPPQSWPFTIPLYGISAFLEDRAGSLWVSVSKDAVYRVGMDGVYQRFELGRGAITSIFEDREGTIWAGSPLSGLYRIRPRLFRTYPEIGSESAHMLFTDNNAGVLFTQGQQVYSINEQGTLESLGVNTHYGAILDQQHTLWAGNVGGLTQWKWNGSQFERTALENRNMFFGCQSLFQANDKSIWFGGNAGGIARHSEGHTEIIDIKTGTVTAFADAGGRNVWMGYDTGKILKTSGASLTEVPGLSNQIKHTISSILVEADESLWIATLGGGLFHWNDGNIAQFTYTSGLPSNEIGGIIRVKDSLWLATTRGVAVVSLPQLQSVHENRSNTVHCQFFGTEDGLPNLECSTEYFPAIHLSKQGTLWIATTEGIASIDVSSIPQKTSQPAVYIEQVLIDDKLISKNSDPIVVPAGPTRISFFYSGITLNAPGKARFQYRLIGNDKDWVDAWDTREAHYTKPLPGDYRFLVRASDQKGAWSVSPASVNIRIEPFFWQTKKFKFGSGTAGVFLVALMAWVVIRKPYIQRIQSLVDERAVEKERARIAEDLHDRLGSQSTQIIFQAKALNDNITRQNWQKMTQCSDLIQKTAQDMTLSLDEIVWTTNPAKDNVESSMAFFLSYAEAFFKNTPTRLRIDVPTDIKSRRFSMESRHEVYLAVREALTNVLKHAHATEVWLRIRLEDDQFRLNVDDNGVGAQSLQVNNERSGLQNIKRRIESVGGTVDFKTNESGGLSVHISIPYL